MLVCVPSMLVCVRVCGCAGVQVCRCACVRVCVCAYVCACKSACKSVCVKRREKSFVYLELLEMGVLKIEDPPFFSTD